MNRINIQAVAQKLNQARQISAHAEDIEPMLVTALRLWQKVMRGEYSNLMELKAEIEGCCLKLEITLHNLKMIGELGFAPMSNGSPLQSVGETGKTKDEG